MPQPNVIPGLPGRRLGIVLSIVCGLLSISPLNVTATEDDSTAPGTPTEQWTDVIKLPPFVVEDETGPPWLIAQLPGVEVLSRCSPNITEKLLDRYQRLLAMLALIYPTELQPQSAIPTALVVTDADQQAQATRQLTEIMQRRFKLDAGDRTMSIMPNFNFWDLDSQVIYFPLAVRDDDRSALTITPAYLRFLLETRSPSLPRWFIEGVVALQRSIVLPVPSISRQISVNRANVRKVLYPYDVVTVLPFEWVSPDKTKEMLSAVKRTARAQGRAFLPDNFPFIPLERLLTVKTLDQLSREEAEIFPYEAALFIRWALDPNPQELRQHGSVSNFGKSSPKLFWEFVANCSTEPFTAQLFTQSFGKPIDHIDERLRGYLPFACLSASTFKLKPDSTPAFKAPEIRGATPFEIARLKGRLERIETIYVSKLYPTLTADYAAQTQRTFHRVKDLLNKDPKLLAEMGLFEVDTQHDEAASPLLQKAVDAGIEHPRAYFELARIQYDQLVARFPDLHGLDDQVTSIEALLDHGLKQNPPLPNSYALLYEIWLRRNIPLNPAQEVQLDEGAKLFPNQFRIVYAAALLNAAQGNLTRASQLVSDGLPIFSSEKQQSRLLQLQQMLANAHAR